MHNTHATATGMQCAGILVGRGQMRAGGSVAVRESICGVRKAKLEKRESRSTRMLSVSCRDVLVVS